MGSVISRAGCRRAIFFVVCACLVAGPALAAGEFDWDRFSVTVSGYRPSVDTQVRLDSTSQVAGTDLDLEQDLQLDDSEILTQYYASLRVSSQISLEGSYFELGRAAQSRLTGSILFGDTQFPVNLDVATAFEADVVMLSMRWALLQSDRMELAASGGAYWMSLKAGIQSEGAGLDELAEADSALPMAGLSFAMNLTRSLQLTLNGDYLPVDYDEFDGSIASYRAGLRYRLLDNMGIGIGYDMLDVDVDSTSASFSGFVKYRQQGPKAFLSLRF